MEKLNINVLINPNVDNSEYIKFLKKQYNVNLISYQQGSKPENINIALFTGGEDISPNFYTTYTNKKSKYNVERDSFEKSMYEDVRYFSKNVLCLGIGRGAQFLNIFSGGKLIQHIEDHNESHLISVLNKYNKSYGFDLSNLRPFGIDESSQRISNQSNNYFEVNSTSSHHQMMNPFGLNMKDYELIAHSTYFRSNIYELGKDNLDLKKIPEFLEPEIIYYDKTNSLCIQGHPEYNNSDPTFSETCLNIINKKLLK